MDQSTLVEMDIKGGESLVNHLQSSGYDLDAACWLREETGEWYLYLITPLVRDDGAKRPAYSRLGEAFRSWEPEVRWIREDSIKVIGPSDPIASDIMEVHRVHPSPKGVPIRWRGGYLGPLYAESGYFYPLPTAQSGQ